MRFLDTRDPLVKALDAAWLRKITEERDTARARIAELEAENARLNMEMAAYRQGCTPKDAAAVVKRYVWDEEGYPPDGMELVAASDYDTMAAAAEVLMAESEARHQSCLVLMKSVQDHRERISELEAALAESREYRYLDRGGEHG